MIATGAGKLRPAFAKPPSLLQGLPQHSMAPPQPKTTDPAADFNLQIAPMMVELAPQVVISTIGYNNKVPGPLLRIRDGQLVTIDVVNDTDVPEFVHWHGLFVPRKWTGQRKKAHPPCRHTAAGAISSWPGRRVRDGTTRTPQP